jgi:hypothetical protein
VTAFAVAGLAIALLASASALSVALAQERLAGRLQAAEPTMKRWGGWVLVLVRAWFVASGSIRRLLRPRVPGLTSLSGRPLIHRSGRVLLRPASDGAPSCRGALAIQTPRPYKPRLRSSHTLSQ